MEKKKRGPKPNPGRTDETLRVSRDWLEAVGKAAGPGKRAAFMREAIKRFLLAPRPLPMRTGRLDNVIEWAGEKGDMEALARMFPEATTEAARAIVLLAATEGG